MNKENLPSVGNGTLPIHTILHGKSFCYRIERVIGQGAYGITYLARVVAATSSAGWQCDMVAIKELFVKAENGREGENVTIGKSADRVVRFRKQFELEVAKLQKLQHPNIIKVLESFEANNTAYYSMEYLDGTSLDELISKRLRLSEAETIRYARDIAAALSYMHEQRILHLDIKPKNIMIHNGKAVLIDFGLSEQYDSDGNPMSGNPIGGGTPGFAPIEQGDRQYGNKFPITIDVYAFGGTMFKMLTGERPPEAFEIMKECCFPEWKLRGVCSQQLLSVVKKCMGPLANDRYQSIKEVLTDINKIIPNNNVAASLQGNKGHYTKIEGEAEYGTWRKVRVPVTESINFPEQIIIRLWDNSSKGISYELRLSDGSEAMCHVRIWQKGSLTNDYAFDRIEGIPSDVRNYIIEHGFLSTVHWENEEATSPLDKNFGYDVSIKLISSDGTEFCRSVKRAHKSYHGILLGEIEGMVKNTCLSTALQMSNNCKHHEQEVSLQPIVMMKGIDRIEVSFFQRFRRGTYIVSIDKTHIMLNPFWREQIALAKIRNKNTKATRFTRFPISEGFFDRILSFIGNQKSVPNGRKMGKFECSESPAIFSIRLFSGGAIQATYVSQSLGGEQFGNLYGDADMLNKEFIKLIPDFDAMLKIAEQNARDDEFVKPKNEQTVKVDDNTTSEESSSRMGLWSIILFILFSLGLFLLALPVYYFTTKSDSYCFGLYLSIGIAEIALVPVWLEVRKDENISNIGLLGVLFFFGGLITYLVLWICQMCSWWL
ncbi:MAG: serine/threonine protein kinase [Muribaculaceae bacterium]